ncbi:DUF6510 family protein [Microbacterium rhizophilus]|uniref:DUF6510 family protein n=1 Tax=Microbacterium rhizophilus TaxID=3138934 RepID=UPI0031F09E60
MSHLDGNALAGGFEEVLGLDITTAVGRCGGCGRTFELGRARAFVSPMGAVMGCAGCDAVLAVVVDARGESIVNLSGLAYITVPRE